MSGLLMASCSMAPQITDPDATERLPESFDRTSDTLGSDLLDPTYTAVSWWEAYRSDVLNELVDSALVANLDLEIAAARVLEVQQAHRVTRSGQFPMVQFNGDGNRQDTPTNLGATGNFSSAIPGFPDRFDITTYSASLGLAYELDFWGRARSSSRAALGAWLAAGAEYEAVRMGVIAEVVATYFEIQDIRTQSSISWSQIDLLKERLSVAKDRYERGIAPSMELYTIQQSLDEARTQLPLLHAAEFDAISRLGVLIGRVPAQVEPMIEHLDLDEWLPAAFPDKMPSEMIRTRPDVFASSARMEAARQMIGVRRAEQFPSFSLTAAGGTQSSTLSNLVETSQKFWLFGGSLTAPIFASGAKRANVKMAWAQYEQAAASYEKTVLNAFKEVSVALNMYEARQSSLAAARSSLAAAEESQRLMTTRYTRGVGDYASLIDARLNRNRAVMAHASAIRADALARLTLYRAVGGKWVE